MRFQLEVVVWRGDIAESRHHVQVAVCDPDGAVQAGTAEPHLVTTFRSAAKPFQLLPLVERGHAERWHWSDEQLAVMAASHTGSARHIALVAGILQRLGLSESHLACGFHEPLDAAEHERLRLHPEARSRLHNNCSGKHAGMLCLALSEGWPVEGYEEARHPVQQLMRSTVAETCGLPPERLSVAVDGCGVSVFGLPLSAMARAYARLASASAAGSVRERALERIRRAMQSFPELVGGEGRLSTALMQACGRLVAKGGAEGLECVGWPEKGLGVALKCEDGNARAISPALIEVLEHLGAVSQAELERLREWHRPAMRNHAGAVVGSLAAVWGAPVTAGP